MAQIGTVRLETQNSGVVDVPVFEPGDSASGIYEFVRVETASGPGFIPVTDPVDATYPYLRVQSQNNGIVAVTDTPGSDIPDSVIDDFNDGQFDADLTGWSWSLEESSYVTVQSSTVLEGSDTARIETVEDLTPHAQVSGSAVSTSEMFFRIEMTGQTENSSDGYNIYNDICIINFNGDGTISGDLSTSASWSTNTHYKFYAKNIDYNNNTFDWELTRVSDDTIIDSNTGESHGASDLSSIRFESDLRFSNTNGEYFHIDDIRISA